MNLVYQLVLYSENVSHEFYKDGKEIQEYEVGDTSFKIIRNKELLVAIGVIDNIECSIGIDCLEDTLKRILESIYTMEDN